MVEIKEMPYNEKYEGAIYYSKLLESFALPLVRDNLGDEKVAKLKNMWQKQAEKIPENGSYEQKYEVAFRNWVRNWQSAYTFAKNQLGEGGGEKFERAAIEENKRRTAVPHCRCTNLFELFHARPLFKQLQSRWHTNFKYSLSYPYQNSQGKVPS